MKIYPKKVKYCELHGWLNRAEKEFNAGIIFKERLYHSEIN